MPDWRRSAGYCLARPSSFVDSCSERRSSEISLGIDDTASEPSRSFLAVGWRKRDLVALVAHSGAG